ncbi:hypothetical protein V1527DRAFT_485690 [Lipomyces starkeyi]
MVRPYKLIVLCDGTWCGKETGTETNIYLLARHMGISFDKEPYSLDEPCRKARYFNGVRLGSTLLDCLIGGAISDDTGRRCTDVYKYIVDTYTEEHEIWMFGLSRGAYIIRCVAGMINNCGIIKRRGTDDETTHLCNEVYRMYQSHSDQDAPHSSQTITFRKTCSWDVLKPIKFMGLLDTVCSMPTTRLNSRAGLAVPEFYDQKVSSEVEIVYHAVSMHDRLLIFQPCPVQKDVIKHSRSDPPHIHEKWFPGTHYDLARQKLNFFFMGPGYIDAVLRWVQNRLISTEPNIVLSDLVLKWMLESIRNEDNSGMIIKDMDDKIVSVVRRLMSVDRCVGSGDLYNQALRYVPLTLLPRMAFFESLLPVRERRIVGFTARTYHYRRPIDQSGETVGQLAKISQERYPSRTYEDFQLRLLATQQISQTTFQCLVGTEHSCTAQQPKSLAEGIPIDVHWQGPEFYNFCDEVVENVLTITRITPNGECYIVRTVLEFLQEFYGDLGRELLAWVKKLCTLKTRVQSTAEVAPRLINGDSVATDSAKPRSTKIFISEDSSTIDTLHLHLHEESVTAYFDDESLTLALPATSDIFAAHVRSALTWIAAVFQLPKKNATGLFSVSYRANEREIGPLQVEPFIAGAPAFSCWESLFSYACIYDLPPGLEVSKRPDGLEIDFDLLRTLARVDRQWLVDDDTLILKGFDTALIPLRPVEHKRWHFIQTPGKQITLEDIYQTNTALRLRLNKSQEEWKTYIDQAGKVYVGWCDAPVVTIGTEKPDSKLLEDVAAISRVNECREIIELEGKSTSRSGTVAATGGFPGGGFTVSGTDARGKQFKLVPLSTPLPVANGFEETLLNAEATPCILWDESLERAWLLPAVSALLFACICYIERVGYTFYRTTGNGCFQYARASNDAAKSARECFRENAGLRKTWSNNILGPQDTFETIVQDVWAWMLQAQEVCKSKRTHRKYELNGRILGYSLSDIIGSRVVKLRELRVNSETPNLKSWEWLARHQDLHMIFCGRVGSVITCKSEVSLCSCSADCDMQDTRGVLSCFLQDLRSFYGGARWSSSSASCLPIADDFQWIPTGQLEHLFDHPGKPLPANGACDCCTKLDRLQSIKDNRVSTSIVSYFKSLLRFSPRQERQDERPAFETAPWLLQPVALRFGSVGQ